MRCCAVLSIAPAGPPPHESALASRCPASFSILSTALPSSAITARALKPRISAVGAAMIRERLFISMEKKARIPCTAQRRCAWNAGMIEAGTGAMGYELSLPPTLPIFAG